MDLPAYVYKADTDDEDAHKRPSSKRASVQQDVQQDESLQSPSKSLRGSCGCVFGFYFQAIPVNRSA